MNMAEFDMPIILILFVVVSAVKWFIEKVKNSQGSQPHDVSESLEEIYEDFRDEIRQRQTEDLPNLTPPPLPPDEFIPEPEPVVAFTKQKKRALSSEEQAAMRA